RLSVSQVAQLYAEGFIEQVVDREGPRTVERLAGLSLGERDQPPQKSYLRLVVVRAPKRVGLYRPHQGREGRYLLLTRFPQTLLQRVPEHERLRVSEPVDVGEDVRHHLDVFGTVDKPAPLQRVEREVVPCRRKHPTAYPREYRPILVVPIHHHHGKPQLRNLPNQRGRCRRLPSACHPEYRDMLSKVLDAEPELVELSPTGPYISQE